MKEWFSKNDIKYTTRMNVFIGRIDHAPESKLASTFAAGRERVYVGFFVLLGPFGPISKVSVVFSCVFSFLFLVFSFQFLLKKVRTKN